jgi:hypothetical protein
MVASDISASAPNSAVGAFRTARDLKDDDHTLHLVNQVDDPEVAHAQTPEVSVGQLRDAGRARLDGQGEDGPTKASGITRGQTSKLTLCG